MRDLAESAREIGFEATNEHLLPIFEDLRLDPEPPVRQAFVEQLPSICRFFKEVHAPISNFSIILFLASPDQI